MAKELLKEAIADAKAVREVALQNAKMALEEAFDSKIKNMLSARLAEELDEDVELEEEYVEEEVDTTDEAVDATEEGMSYDEDDKVKEVEDSIDEDIDEEINLDELMAELEEMSYEEDDKVDEAKDDDDMKEGKKDDEKMEEGEQLDEMVGLAVVGGIIAAAGGMNAFLEKGRAGKLSGKAEKVYQGLEGAVSGAGAARRSEGTEETNESIDIDALISEIESELEEGKKKKDDDDDMKEGKKKDKEEKEKMKEELAEALSTVNSLKSTISEMNLLNSKLLYCNKLFRANALTEAQKVKVVDALDKSTTTGEAKLVFETLQESFNFTGVEKRAIKEGLGRASKAAGTAPKKVIMESTDETVSRFQKLANIKL